MTTDPFATGPGVIGTTQLQAHRNYPCRLLSRCWLARLVRAALVSASRPMGAPIKPIGFGSRKRIPALEQGRARSAHRCPGIVPSGLLLFKCPASVPV